MRRAPRADPARIAPDKGRIRRPQVSQRQRRRIAHIAAPFAFDPSRLDGGAKALLGGFQRGFITRLLRRHHLAEQYARAIGVGDRGLGRATGHADQARSMCAGHGAGLCQAGGVVGFVIDIKDQTGPGHGGLLFQDTSHQRTNRRSAH